ncbi:MAG: HIT domain-containing protein [Candidatus Saganbacteria bacterium]|nr:HIT domain-containing protein [Candidatus Saganbacteria bacterium]
MSIGMRLINLSGRSEAKAKNHYLFSSNGAYHHFYSLGKDAFIDTVSKIHSIGIKELSNGFRVIISREFYGIKIHVIGGEPLVSPFMQDCKDGIRPSPSEVEEKSKEKCVMCKFADGRIQLKPEEIVADDASFLVINPLSRNAAIHNVLFPKKPYRDLIEGGGDLQFWGRAYDYFCKREQEDLSEGFRLISNNRNWAGQQTQHLHIHILGGEKLPSPFWQDWAK